MSRYTEYRDEIITLLNTKEWCINDNIPDFEGTINQFEIEIDKLTEGKLLNFIKSLGETEEDYTDKLSLYESIITKYCQNKIKTEESLNFYFQFCF